MKLWMLIILLLIVSGSCIGAAGGERSIRVRVEGGSFIPMYSSDNVTRSVIVKDFWLDSKPVTNAQFYLFIKVNPSWLKNGQSKLVSDGNLLKHWKTCSDRICPDQRCLEKPVVNVSWFAAEDFCRWKGGRLPSVLEWEYAAAANEKTPNAGNDPRFYEQQLAWYASPGTKEEELADVGKSKPNYWGLYDMHGLVWEWTSDFNSVFVSGDNRSEGDNLTEAFCGAGAASAADKANYAAFMRYAMRNSLKGRYTTSNLGFRCAYDRE